MMRYSVIALLLACALPAQASGRTFFLPSAEQGSGGTAVSTTWRITGSFGAGAVPSRATSQRYVLSGGFPASLDVPVTGRPWLTAVRPFYAPIMGGTALQLHGTELHLGASASVKIGGKVAAITSRTRNAIAATLPVQTTPGWTRVDVTAGGETTSLPKAIGILPLIEVSPPAEPGIPFQITYRGTQGDIVVWLLAAGKGPFPFPVPPFHYGFELDIATFLVLTVTPVVAASGTAELPLPAVVWSRPILFQTLAVSQTTGYAPGSFSNAVRL